jgi:spermidine synthase
MSLELMGSRLLAPNFGDSIFVWGSLIGVVMSSLAVGYYFGGMWADKNPSYRVLSLIIFLSGILVILIPLSAPLILEIVVESGLGEKYGPILASTLMLAAPTILLGMISPYALRVSTDEIITVGGVSGSLSSVSTIGSIFGTFFTVFVLIPSFGVREIILSLGLILVGVSLIGLPWPERFFAIVLLALLIMPSSLFAGFVSVQGGEILFSGESAYSSIRIIDSDDTRTMYLNNMPHSAMFLNGSNNAVFAYTDYFNLGFLFKEEINSVLFIGGGGFSGPKQFIEYYPELTIDVVEIDKKVVELAHRFFNLEKENPRIDIFVKDGRSFLRAAEKYDLIVLDAYSKTYVPFHLMTKEFYQELKEHLNPHGVIVSNLISSLVGDTSDLLYCEVKTIEEVIPNVYLFATKTGVKSVVQNILLVATENTDYLGKNELNLIASNKESYQERLKEYVLNFVVIEENQVKKAFVLTDNFAPTEDLLNPVTLAPYKRGEALTFINVVNPFIIAVTWVIALIGLFLIFNNFWRIKEIVAVNDD